MSTFSPTTTLQVQKPTVGEDEYGDALDSFATETPNVPATMAERRRRVWDPTEGRVATIAFWEALIPGHVPVAKGYRLVEPDGNHHFVDHVYRPQNVAFPGAVQRLELVDPTGGGPSA